MPSKTEFQEKLDTAWEEVTEKDNSKQVHNNDIDIFQSLPGQSLIQLSEVKVSLNKMI